MRSPNESCFRQTFLIANLMPALLRHNSVPGDAFVLDQLNFIVSDSIYYLKHKPQLPKLVKFDTKSTNET